MSVLLEINGIFFISATADFIRRYASYVIRHLNWSLLIPLPPPLPSDLDGQPFCCSRIGILISEMGKSVKVLQIQRQLVDMNVIFRPQVNNDHAIFMPPTSKEFRGHIDLILSACPLWFLADTIS